jgi:3-deoxy-D-manno-octulosonic-acid transferase
MTYLYNLIIFLTGLAIRLGSFTGNAKARQWINGQKDLFKTIEAKLQPGEKRIWVHAASLGEFEQGRPLIESLRKEFPEYVIVLTFFSPSGYEVRKNYSGANYIFYLPLDTRPNALRFIELVNPEKVLFIKYEFWYNYLLVLKNRSIPVYLFSTIFRTNQLFFKWYGGWYRGLLSLFDHLFVQTEQSRKLLATIGIKHVSVTGDTRFDRVFDIASQAKEIPEIEMFVDYHPCLIAGSTWEPDETLLARYINHTTQSLKYIIAPHEIDEEHIKRLERIVNRRTVRYSIWKQDPSGSFDVLIIDNVGMLSSLYRYGMVAYIGGGFGKGIHNILEAATFGLPVIFGPKHQKFQEALDLVAQRGAFSVRNFEELTVFIDKLFIKDDNINNFGTNARNYVKQNIGATNMILSLVMSR